MKKKLQMHLSVLEARSLKLGASSGFTLVEMLVAFGIFAIIMVVAVGSLVSLMEANHKSQALKTVVNNLHFALENISRNVRTGTNYHCGGGSIALPQDCPSTPSDQLVFRTRDGGYMLYLLDGGQIKRAQIGPDDDINDLLLQANWIPITAPEIVLGRLSFYVDGASGGDNRQPRVLILMRGSVQGKSKVISKFNIQTLVSQRLLDVQD